MWLCSAHLFSFLCCLSFPYLFIFTTTTLPAQPRQTRTVFVEHPSIWPELRTGCLGREITFSVTWLTCHHIKIRYKRWNLAQKTINFNVVPPQTKITCILSSNTLWQLFAALSVWQAGYIGRILPPYLTQGGGGIMARIKICVFDTDFLNLYSHSSSCDKMTVFFGANIGLCYIGLNWLPHSHKSCKPSPLWLIMNIFDVRLQAKCCFYFFVKT